MKTALKFVLMGTVLLALYLLLWPVPISPQSWNAPQSPGYTGDFAPNEALADLQAMAIPLGDDGPEDLAEGPEGLIYFTTHGGRIMRFNPARAEIGVFAETGGRPLGLEFDNTGTLFVADAYLGLLRLSDEGAVTVLSDRVSDNDPILYADDLDIAPDGRIYFSDASTKFGAKASGGTLEGSLLELMEHGRTGRLLVFDPVSGETSVVLDDLAFANGVAMCPDGSCLMLAETGRYRILKVSLLPDSFGEYQVIIDNIPGFPDNINDNGDGTFWAGMTSPRSEPLDNLSDKPFVRKMVQRLPAALRPKARNYGFVIKFDESGQILENLQDPAGTYTLTTGAMETDDRVYISSLGATDIGWVDK